MSEADDIARFIAERGVTRCPSGFAVETQAAVDPVITYRKPRPFKKGRPAPEREGRRQPGRKDWGHSGVWLDKPRET